MRSGRLVQDLSSSKPPGDPYFRAEHDGVVHFPLGAASYIYEKEFTKPKLRELGLIPPSAHFPHHRNTSSTTPSLPNGSTELRPQPSPLPGDVDSDSGISLTPEPASQSTSTLIIHIGAQPNNSPHAGTIVTFALAFLVARAMKREYATLRARAAAEHMDLTGWADYLDVRVQLDLVDTAPDSAKTTTGPDGIVSHRSTGAMRTFLPDYDALLAELSEFIGGEVEYTVTYQDALMRAPAMRDALRTIIIDRTRLAPEHAPQREALAIRCACPAPDCGTADKHGILNEYAVTPDSTTITFQCPTHGPHSVHLEDPDERARVELNTPLRNLARTLVYMADTVASRRPDSGGPPARAHMRVTGADYAGPYQESMLFRPLARLAPRMQPPLPLDEDGVWPVFVYAPLITDWSGAKLSKSLYVRAEAYRYLRDAGLDWLLEFRRMKEEGRDRTVLYRMVETWVENPTMLFCRNYSLEYVGLMCKEAEREKQLGADVVPVIGVKRKAEEEGER
ncbi:hypothetical protein LXA43DRAFT_1074852 [Ganoderma leucocontextum]|nr:hypothetical protein LXA43DRAFT_1074852 [Ganoderma leucocontextum]